MVARRREISTTDDALRRASARRVHRAPPCAADQRIRAGDGPAPVGPRAGRIALPDDVPVMRARRRRCKSLRTPLVRPGCPRLRTRLRGHRPKHADRTPLAATSSRGPLVAPHRNRRGAVVEPVHCTTSQCGTLRRTHHDQPMARALAPDFSRSPSPRASWPATASPRCRRRASAAGGRTSPARISSTRRSATTRPRSPIR